MKTIHVELAESAYPVYLGRGLLTDSSLWQRHLGRGKVLVVSNETVAPIYFQALNSSFCGREVRLHTIPDGEQHKTVETWYGIIDILVGMQARRDATLVALGGGVVGDIAGFAAACYMRGIRFLQAPTTLLAQVDASVGGKTAINHKQGKNLVGAFHQPTAVVVDSATLNTLPTREFNAGMAEVVKYGAIRDAGFFDWLENSVYAVTARAAAALDHMIHESILNKAEIVVKDEKESGIRALLNFGHSFGHALEADTRYDRFLHGEAVAIGMVVAAQLSEARGLCAPGTASRIGNLLRCFGLPVQIPADLSITGLASALELDKKAVVSGLRLILLTGLGNAVVDADSTDREITSAMRANRDRPLE
jgi:3-dehydroquinate synthase